MDSRETLCMAVCISMLYIGILNIIISLPPCLSYLYGTTSFYPFLFTSKVLIQIESVSVFLTHVSVMTHASISSSRI